MYKSLLFYVYSFRGCHINDFKGFRIGNTALKKKIMENITLP